jgi:hypothetical protein
MAFSGHPQPATTVSATSVFRRPKGGAETAGIAEMHSSAENGGEGGFLRYPFHGTFIDAGRFLPSTAPIAPRPTIPSARQNHRKARPFALGCAGAPQGRSRAGGLFLGRAFRLVLPSTAPIRVAFGGHGARYPIPRQRGPRTRPKFKLKRFVAATRASYSKRSGAATMSMPVEIPGSPPKNEKLMPSAMKRASLTFALTESVSNCVVGPVSVT